MGMLQIIDDESVLFDFDDSTGAANPHGLKTRIDDLDIGEVESEESTFATGRPGLRIASRIPRQATMSWIMRVDPYASIDAGLAGVRELGRLLEAGGVMLYQPDGVTMRKFIDYLPASSSPLIRGQPRGLLKILKLLQDPDGAGFEVRRQPLLRGDELDSSVNKLKDPTLTLDQIAPTGTPDDWTWNDTTGITNQSIDAEANAYRFDIATTGVRMLQQITAAASFPPGDVASFYFYGWVSGGTDIRVRCRIEYLNSSNTVLATHDASGLTTLGTAISEFSNLAQAVSFTAPAAPANTDRVRVSMRFENAAATSRTVWLTLAQGEKTGAPSLWVPGEQTVPNNPALSGGRVFPVYVHGDAPVPAEVRVIPTSGNFRSLMVGRKSPKSLPDWMNTRKIVQAESMTPGTNTALVADALASPGSGNSAMNTTFATSNVLTVDRLSWSLATLLAAIEGDIEIWARLRSTAINSTFRVETRFAVLNVPQPIGDRTITFTDTAFLDVSLASLTVPESSDQMSFQLRYMRTAGTGDLRVDLIAHVPTDYLGIVDSAYLGGVNERLVSSAQEDKVWMEKVATGLRTEDGVHVGKTPVELVPGFQGLYIVIGSGTIGSGRLNDNRLISGRTSIRYAPQYYQ